MLKKPVTSVPSSGRPVWLTTLVTSGKDAEHDASLIHDAQAFGGASAGSEGAANPDGAFVEMGKKLGADNAAEAEEEGEKRGHSLLR